MMTKNGRDIINYISLLTAVLNRLSLDPESSEKLQARIRTALISAVCQLTVQANQVFSLTSGLL